MRRLVLIFLLSCHAATAATNGETRAFNAGVQIFRDKKYDVAEQVFADFLAKNPDSEVRAEAVLYRAKALVHLENYAAAVVLLESELPQSGIFADQYRFWIAEAFFREGQFEIASEKYADVVRNHMDSPLVTEAAYNKAYSFAQLGNWQKVIELLGPDRSFTKLTASKPNDRFAILGILLRAEGLFTVGQFEEAVRQLELLNGRTLDADAQWRHRFLLARTLLAQKQFDLALTSVSNAVELSKASGRQGRIADSIQLHAEILEASGRLKEAVEVYEQNLAPVLPEAQRRQALFKSIQLTIDQGKHAEAITRLEQFINQNPGDTTLDLALFTLGELRMKQVFALEKNSTNDAINVPPELLQTALTNFNLVISNFPKSDLIGKAYLNRGWCYWVERNIAEAQTNFVEAVARLPKSEEQGIARFKLADTLFLAGDYSGAISNYNALIDEFADVPAIKSTLFDQALYQIVRASLEKDDAESARDAMARILEWYPNSGYADRSVLLVGLGLNRKGSPAIARRLFTEFLKRWPDSSLAPEVNLALAQTHVREAQWAEALTSFEMWATTFTNSPLLPQAEFGRALATYHTGMETNALKLFTEFISRHSTNRLAAVAQNWIGDFYFNREDYAAAEENYQLVSKLNPALEVACQAKIGGGRAAFKRDDFKAARAYFLSVINEPNTPADYVFEAYFGLGDTMFAQFLSNPEGSRDDFRDAVQAFRKVAAETNSLSALAWGRLGECHLQWGNIHKEPSSYEDAIKAFQQAIEFPNADLRTRSLARLGLGKVYEAAGKPMVAWEHYSRLIYLTEDEPYDPKCVKEAGLAAAKLCEIEGQWEQAMNIYRRLLTLVPALRPAVEKKMASAQANLDSVRN